MPQQMESYKDIVEKEKEEALDKAKTALKNSCKEDWSIELVSLNAKNKTTFRNTYLKNIKEDADTYDIICVLIYINSIW